MTCKTAKKGKGKEIWSRKVESPVVEAKREASRELIQGKNSTIQDKENASKHLLALIHGSQKKSKSSPANKTCELINRFYNIIDPGEKSKNLYAGECSECALDVKS